MEREPDPQLPTPEPSTPPRPASRTERAGRAAPLREGAEPGRRRDRSGRRWDRMVSADVSLPIDPDLDPQDPAEPSRQHRPGRRWSERYAPVVLVAVFAGGALGTLGRYGVELALPTPKGGFPVATFVVNTSGALLIGLLMSVLAGRPGLSRRVRPFAGVGVLGGWTTMSTLAVGTDLLGRAGAFARAGGYASATLVAGVAAVAIGISLGRRFRGAVAGAAAGAPDRGVAASVGRSRS